MSISSLPSSRPPKAGGPEKTAAAVCGTPELEVIQRSLLELQELGISAAYSLDGVTITLRKINSESCRKLCATLRRSNPDAAVSPAAFLAEVAGTAATRKPALEYYNKLPGSLALDKVYKACSVHLSRAPSERSLLEVADQSLLYNALLEHLSPAAPTANQGEIIGFFEGLKRSFQLETGRLAPTDKVRLKQAANLHFQKAIDWLKARYNLLSPVLVLAKKRGHKTYLVPTALGWSSDVLGTGQRILSGVIPGRRLGRHEIPTENNLRNRYVEWFLELDAAATFRDIDESDYIDICCSFIDVPLERLGVAGCFLHTFELPRFRSLGSHRQAGETIYDNTLVVAPLWNKDRSEKTGLLALAGAGEFPAQQTAEIELFTRQLELFTEDCLKLL